MKVRTNDGQYYSSCNNPKHKWDNYKTVLIVLENDPKFLEKFEQQKDREWKK